MEGKASRRFRLCRLRDDGRGEVEANWQVLSFRSGQTTMCSYEYLLDPHEKGSGASGLRGL